MATTEQVRRLTEQGLSYEQVGRSLGVDPGLAYLVGTGLPADGSDAPDPAVDRPGVPPTSTQRLANPERAENPTDKGHVWDWVRARVRADAAMTAAAAGRDAAPGEIEDPDVEVDVVDVLTRDHNQVTAMVKQLSTIPGHRQGGGPVQVGRRQSIVDMITVALSRHEAVEEEHLWPAVRDALPDGDQRAETALRQEQEGKDLLVALSRADPDSDEFDELVEKLVAALRQHVAFEERVFLDLRAQLPDGPRVELADRVRRSERSAPTRPHPHAPQSPGPLVTAAGLPAAAADRLRDAVGDRPARRRGRAPGEAAGEGAGEDGAAREPGGSGDGGNG